MDNFEKKELLEWVNEAHDRELDSADGWDGLMQKCGPRNE